MSIYCAFCNEKIYGGYTTIYDGSFYIELCDYCEPFYYEYKYLNNLEY